MPGRKGVDLFSLSNKTALVTGATGYLGSAMVFALAEAGAHVLVNSRSQERCDALVKSVRGGGFSAAPAVFDVTSAAAIELFFSQHRVPINILINNAYLGGAGSIELASEASYVSSYGVTLVAAHHLLIQALPWIRKAVESSGDASVINLGSMYGMVSPDQRLYEAKNFANPPFYGAAKAALMQWTRYAACEFGPEGIRVNSLSPGPFPSDAVQEKDPAFIRRLSQKVPMGRIGLAEEIKGPTLFLASPAASYVNGCNLVVDGGWTCW